MRVNVPADYESALHEMAGLTALLDKNGFTAAAYIAACVSPDPSPPSGRVSAEHFARDLNARGWSKDTVAAHFDAWQRAAAAGVVPLAEALRAGEEVCVPESGWQDWYTPAPARDSRYARVAHSDDIVNEAREAGLGGSKAVDIAKNLKSLRAAIMGSPVVATAARAALVARAIKHAPSPRLKPAGHESPSWMDVDRAIEKLHDSILELRRTRVITPDSFAHRVERLKRERELLSMVIETAGPITDEMIAELMASAR